MTIFEDAVAVYKVTNHREEFLQAMKAVGYDRQISRLTTIYNTIVECKIEFNTTGIED